MKTPNLIIRVPEPCHEDWNKMQPNDKGRFCSSCEKSVFDFSNKTDQEIRDLLVQHQGQKLCGHFKKTQVDRPLQLNVNLAALPRNAGFSRTFAIALFLVFGGMLFSCYDSRGQKFNGIEILTGQNKDPLNYVRGEMTALPATTINPVSANPDSLVSNTPEQFVDGDIVMEEQFIAGGLSVSVIEPDTNEKYIKGKMAVSETDSCVKNGEPQKKDTVETPEPHYLGGLIAMEIEIPDDENTDTLAISSAANSGENKNPKQIVGEESSLVVYPNPGKGEFVIKYNVLKRSDVRMDLVDGDGRVLSAIVNVNGQHEGKYQIPVSLDLPNGLYFVSLINNGKRATSKLIIER